ncbi:restriction endonuclease subunit S [Methanocalculus chunghsingensis]|uniref:restriction endonuclease subunit S n=1 Tax=Methanocalculus chunghsingensis TaxID=156457 RepID=UPI001B8C72A1|nr:restriction endonuclease subunit S [Methanocalculus chunghsingensis]
MMTETTTQETDLLFQHFATLATGPDGIARLRELILQLAVQGKLGTQDPGDEPAGFLMDRINLKKARLDIKTRKKTQNDFPPFSDEDSPFHIPNNWIWTQLGELFEITSSKRIHESDWKSSGIPFLRAREIVSLLKGEVFSSPIFISEELYEKVKLQTGVPEPNDILVTGVGTVGIPYIVTGKEKFYFKDGNVVWLKNSFSIYAKFIELVVKSPYISNVINETHGTTVKTFTIIKAKSLVIPLPPLAEQHRIVEKVDRLMALCDELERQQQQERSTCLRLGTASFAGLQNAESPGEFGGQWAQICDTFDLMLDCPENVAVLRQTILHLAVQGKLGTQNERDEPASVLSKKILDEKKKLQKQGIISRSRSFPEITSEEKTYAIPKKWLWLRLDDIGHNWGQKEPNNSFTYIDVAAIDNKKGEIGDYVDVLLPDEAPSRARKLVRKGTLIYSTVRPYLLNIAIIEKEFNPEPIVSTAFAVLHPFEGISNRYLFYYLRSKPFIAYVESQMKGMAYPAINDQKFHMGLIPVPPTAEQHRIVEKVDRLMALCDQLEAQLKGRAGVQERFAKAVVGGITP